MPRLNSRSVQEFLGVGIQNNGIKTCSLSLTSALFYVDFIPRQALSLEILGIPHF